MCSTTITVDADPSWLLSDATFEKMGVLMAENGGRLLGLYDEMSAFLTKIKLYSSRGLTDSHELAMFLELYNANPWTRTTGLLLTEWLESPCHWFQKCYTAFSINLIQCDRFLTIHFLTLLLFSLTML